MKHLAAAAIGLGLAISSAIQVNYALPFLPMCTSGSCQQALRSDFSHLAGAPLSVLGILFWIAQIALLRAIHAPRSVRLGELAEHLQLGITLAGVLATAIAMALLYLKLSSPCIFCTWHGITVLLFAFAILLPKTLSGSSAFWSRSSVSLCFAVCLSAFLFLGRGFLFAPAAEPIRINAVHLAGLAQSMGWKQGDTIIFANPHCSGCEPIMKYARAYSESTKRPTRTVIVPLGRRATDYTILTNEGYALASLQKNRMAFDQLGLSSTPTIINYDATGGVRVSKLQFVWLATIRK